MAVRVFVVDDSDVFIDAVREVLDACPEFDLIGSAHSGEAAIPSVRRLAPDLVLVDVILPGMDGLETCRNLAMLTTPPFVILCSVGEDPRSGKRLDECPDAPFLAKARISPGALRRAWESRPAALRAPGRG